MDDGTGPTNDDRYTPKRRHSFFSNAFVAVDAFQRASEQALQSASPYYLFLDMIETRCLYIKNGGNDGCIKWVYEREEM